VFCHRVFGRRTWRLLGAIQVEVLPGLVLHHVRPTVVHRGPRRCATVQGVACAVGRGDDLADPNHEE
jgi:hypothetical protein